MFISRSNGWILITFYVYIDLYAILVWAMNFYIHVRPSKMGCIILCRPCFHLSVNFRVCSISFKPLERLFWNLGQIFALSRQCAEVLFYQCLTKIKVTLRGRSSKDNISCPLHILETDEDLLMKFCTTIKYHQMMCREWEPKLHLHFLLSPLVVSKT